MPIDPAAGVWTGTFKSPELKGAATGLVMANGTARWFTTDGALLAGSFKGKNDAVTGKLYVNRGSAPTQIAKLSGKLSADHAKGTFKGDKLAGSFDLKRMPTERRAAKLTDASGDWRRGSVKATVTDAGKLTGITPAGCRWSGQFSAPLRDYRAFTLQLDVTKCAQSGNYGGQALLIGAGDQASLILGASRPGGIIVEFLKRSPPNQATPKPAGS